MLKKPSFFHILLTLCLGFFPLKVNAQITPASDGTGTTITQNGNQINITGGSLNQNQTNLFHSFSQFNLNQDQIANFLSQPNIVNILGRITGGSPSNINGLIQVTGGNSNLYLINPSGIIFGQNASLNVSGDFTATTANAIGIGNNWFNAIGNNNYNILTGTPQTFAFLTQNPGSIINAGNLQTSQGSITLLGGTVINTGTISTPNGNITITAIPGEKFVKISQEGSILNLEVPIDKTGLNSVTNNPLSLPQLLTGGNISDVTGITIENNKVKLTKINQIVSTDTGTNIISGNITGNNINILGEKVGIFKGNIITLGKNGGNIYIGGDYQGKGTLPKAEFTYIDSNSNIKAEGIQGGNIIVWSDKQTKIDGNLSVKGFDQGGFIETSSKGKLDITTIPDISGKIGGTWLIDPTNIDIIAGSGNSNINNSNPFTSTGDSSQLGINLITSALNSGNVTIATSGGGTQSGNITLSTNLIYSGNTSTLTLNAHGNININGQINSTTNPLNLIFTADSQNTGNGGVSINQNITTSGGNLTVISDTSSSLLTGLPGIYLDPGSTINTGIGNISLTGKSQNFDAINLRGNIISSNGNITFNGNTTGNYSGVYVRGNVIINGSGTITINGNGNYVGSYITVANITSNSGDIIVNDNNGNMGFYTDFSNITSNSGNIRITANNVGSYGIRTGGNTNITSQSGNIILNGGTTGLSIDATNDNITANSGNITLTGNNTIINKGQITANSTASVININSSAGSIILGNTQGQGNLIVNSPSTITQLTNTSLNISNNTTLTSVGDITLNNNINDFNQVFITSGNNVNLTDTNNLILGNSILSGNLSAIASGNITGNNLTSSGNNKTFTLQSNNNISLNGNINSTNPLNVILTADNQNTGSGNVIINGNIITSGGNITVRGNTSLNNAGIFINSGFNINTGSGNISLTGISSGTGNVARGINLEGNLITTSGNITLTGNQNNLNGNAESVGIYGTILSNSGNVILSGLNLGNGNNAGGIISSGNITTTSGNITLTGNNTNTNNNSQGVILQFSTITSNTGNVNLTGISSGNGDLSRGVELQGNINTVGGNININGTSRSIGIFAYSGNLTSNTGNITLTGNNTSGNSTYNWGTLLQANTLSTTSGNINITGNNQGSNQNVAIAQTILSNTGNITINADTLDLNPGFGNTTNITGNGTLNLLPLNANTNITLGGSSSANYLNDTEITKITNGFTSIIIGRTDSSGNINIGNTVTFNDPITLRSPSGNINVNNPIIGSDNSSITFNSANTILNANITTNNQSIIFTGTRVTPNANVTINSGNDLNLNARIDYDGIGIDKTLTFLTKNDIYINQAIVDSNLTTSDKLNLSFQANSDNIGFGRIRVNNSINTQGGNITMLGNGSTLHGIEVLFGITSGGGDINLTSTSDTGTGFYLFGGSINSNGGNVNITGTTNTGFAGIHLQDSINANSGNITLTSDSLDIDTNLGNLTGTGNITLQPLTPSFNFTVGGSGGYLSNSEILRLNNGFNSVTIGRSNGSGTITVNNVSFNDPVTIQNPSGNIIVNGLVQGLDNSSITLKGNTTLNNNITTNNNNINFNNPVTVSNFVTLNAGTSTINFNNTLTDNDTLTLIGGEINFTGNVTGNGNLILQPFTSGQNIIIGSGNNLTSSLDITLSEINLLQSGLSQVIVGGNILGNITIAGNVTFNNPINLQTSGNGIINGTGFTITGNNNSIINILANQNINIGCITNSGRDININSINGTISTSAINTTSNTDGGNININANGNITTVTLATTSNNTGNSGTITLQSTTGNIATNTINTSSLVSANAGNITIIANGNISTSIINSSANGTGTSGNTGNVNITSRTGNISTNIINTGSSRTNGNAGNVTISATQGTVNTSTITANSNTGGGNINVNANGNISIGAIVSQSGNTGNSGTVTLQSTTGNITTGGIDVSSRITANGGNVNITANGNVITSFITTSAFNTGTSGNSGDVNITSRTGNFTTNNNVIDTSSLRTNGNGGNITISAFQGTVNTSTITTNSNTGGGNVNINANGNISIGAIATINNNTGNSGTITLQSTTGNINTSSIDASSRITANGGNITITANGNVNTNFISTSAFATGNSGNSGKIDIISNTGNVNTSSIDTRSFRISGNGGNVTISSNQGINVTGLGIISYTDVTGNTGNAGDINLTANNGNITTTNVTSSTRANGGGNAANGGNIIVTANNGNITTDAIHTGSYVFGVGSSQNSGNVNLTASGNITTNRIDTSSFGTTGQGTPGNINVNSGNIIDINSIGTVKQDFIPSLVTTIKYGDVTLVGNEINFTGGGNRVVGTGNITLQSNNPSQSISLGANIDNNTSSLEISNTDLNSLQNGFANVIIGSTRSTGAISIDGNATFNDPVIMRSPSNIITINNPITLTDNAALTFNSTNVFLNANITQSNQSLTLTGNNITLGGNVTLSGNIDVNINSPIDFNNSGTDKTLTILGNGNIAINQSIRDTNPGNDKLNILLNSSSGQIQVNNNINTEGGNLNISGNQGISLNGAIAANTGNITLSSDNITLGNTASISGNGILTLQSLTLNQNITIGGNLPTSFLNDSELNKINTGFNQVVIQSGNITLNSGTFNNPVSFQTGVLGKVDVNGDLTSSNSITFNTSLTNLGANISTTNGNINFNNPVTLTNNSTLTANGSINFGNVVAIANNNLTLIGNDLNFNNTISGTGNLTLSPFQINQNLIIGGNLSTSFLNDSDLNKINTGFNQVIIGRPDSTGNITLNSSSFNNPISFQTGVLGKVDVQGNLTSSNSITFNTSLTNLGANISTTNGNITFNNPVNVNNPVTLTSNNTINFNQTLNTGSNSLTLIGNDLNFNNTVSGTGNLTLSSNQDINIGGNLSTSFLNDSDLSKINTGFNQVVIQSSTGNITLNSGTFNNPISFQTGVLGKVDVQGNLTSSNSITFNSGLTNLGANISTTNGNITFNNPVTLTNNSIVSANGSINFGNVVAIANNNLTLKSLNDVTFNKTVSGLGNLTLIPLDPNQIINVGGTQTPNYDITTNTLSNIQPGLKTLIIGDNNTLGNINIKTGNFINSLTVNTQGIILVERLITGQNLSSITLSGNTILNDGINTNSQPININGNLTLGNNIILNTGLRGDININGKIDGINNEILLKSGLGDINVRDSVNVGKIEIETIGNSTFNSTINANTLITNIGGNTVLNGNVTTLGEQNYRNGIKTTAPLTLNSSNGNINTRDISGNSSITLKGNNVNSGNINIQGNVTLNSVIGNVNIGDINTSGVTGGNITITAIESINIGKINSSGSVGNGGNVFIDPRNDIKVEFINTQGGINGKGGNVYIQTENNVHIPGTFVDQNGKIASISSSGGNGIGGDIIIIQKGPFFVGNSLISGTNGVITTGNDNTITPLRLIPDPLFIDKKIAILNQGNGNNEGLQQLIKNTLEKNELRIENTAGLLNILLTDNTKAITTKNVINNIDEPFSKEFGEYIGKNVAVDNLKNPQEILNQIETATGVKPALIYVLFTPSGNQIKTTEAEKNEIKETDELEIIMITGKGNPVRKRIIGTTRAEVLATVKKLRLAISSNSKSGKGYIKSSKQLYEWIIAPIEKELEEQKITNLVFLMDGGLRATPLAALYNGETFLIEKYSIGLMPSLSITNTNYTNIKTTEVLAMGSDTFARETLLQPLPAVSVEINAIASKVWKGNSFLNEQFTLENLKLQRRNKPYGIIHLATHAEFRPGNLENSYIQLWDGQLKLDKLRELGWDNPPVELLVLSACKTAIGDEKSELGFAGLAVAAGVKTAMGSLWYVSDEGTLGLMTNFYAKLRKAPIKAEALRQAQISMIKGEVKIEKGKLVTPNGVFDLPPDLAKLDDSTLSNPYYWSGFVMIGNPW